MRKTNRLLSGAAWLSLIAIPNLALAALDVGDRNNPDEVTTEQGTIEYPDEMFYSNSADKRRNYNWNLADVGITRSGGSVNGRIIDVTSFGANGNDSVDDTDAFIAMYNFLAHKIEERIDEQGLTTEQVEILQNEENDYVLNQPETSYTFYIPDGDYIVSKPLFADFWFMAYDFKPDPKNVVYRKNGTGAITLGSVDAPANANEWKSAILRTVGNYHWGSNPIVVGPYRLMHNVRIVGQSREGVSITLQAGSYGFDDPDNPLPVISFASPKTDFDDPNAELETKGNNTETMAYVRNLTLKIDSGNPGAMGIKYVAANSNGLQNLSIIDLADPTEDPALCGIFMGNNSSQTYNHDITIEGFKYGIVGRVNHASIDCFEYLTLRNQRTTAVYSMGRLMNFRKVLSDQNNHWTKGIEIISNTFESKETNAQVIVLDSIFRCPTSTSSNVALQSVDEAHLFVRNVEFENYNKGIRVWGLSPNEFYSKNSQGTAYVVEFNSQRSSPVLEAPDSLNMEPEEFPQIPAMSDSDWHVLDLSNTPGYVNALNGFLARRPKTEKGVPVMELDTDDLATYPISTDLQNALNTAKNQGKKGIIFKQSAYHFHGGSVNVPAEIEVIDLAHARLYGNSGYFNVSEYSDKPLFIINGTKYNKLGLVAIQSNRPVVMDFISGGIRTEETTTGTLFHTRAKRTGDGYSNLNVYARMINNEPPDKAGWVCDNSNVWVFGFKREGNHTAFDIVNGQNKLAEILGGFVNPEPGVGATTPIAAHIPAFNISNGNASIIAQTNQHGPNDKPGYIDYYATLISFVDGSTVNYATTNPRFPFANNDTVNYKYVRYIPSDGIADAHYFRAPFFEYTIDSEPDTAVYYTIQGSVGSQFYLRDNGGVAKADGNNHQWATHWEFVSTDADGYFLIRNRVTDDYLHTINDGNSSDPGYSAVQCTDNINIANHKAHWKVEVVDLEAGLIRLVNRNPAAGSHGKIYIQNEPAPSEVLHRFGNDSWHTKSLYIKSVN